MGGSDRVIMAPERGLIPRPDEAAEEGRPDDLAPRHVPRLGLRRDPLHLPLGLLQRGREVDGSDADRPALPAVLQYNVRGGHVRAVRHRRPRGAADAAGLQLLAAESQKMKELQG